MDIQSNVVDQVKLRFKEFIPGCGGGTISYCANINLPEWPRYMRKSGIWACSKCRCREPIIHNAVINFSLIPEQESDIIIVE